MVSPTQQLAQFAAELRFEDIPPAVVRHAQRLVLDAIGCGLFGSSLGTSRLLGQMLVEVAPAGDVTVWGRPYKLALLDAAMANGYSVDCFESDDVHKDGLIHAEPVVVPTCLGLGETMGTYSGRDLLTAVVAGCEVGARIGLTTGYGMILRGFHSAALTGAFCAAAACGRLLGLDAAAMRHALGISGTFAAGLISAQRGAMVKAMHLGRAAQNGLYGALLARRGFTGISDILEAPYGGFVTTVTDQPRWEQLTLGLGSIWQTQGVGFKYYPCGASTHTAIGCALQLRAEQTDLTPDAIAAVEVVTTTLTRDHAGWTFDPAEGPGSARLNIPWCTAVALVKGGVTVDDFLEPALTDPTLQAVAARVRVSADPAMDTAGVEGRHAVRLTLHARDGHRYSARASHGKGSHIHPLSDSDVAAKFADLAGRVLGPQRTAAVTEAVWGLPEASDVGNLGRALALA